MSKQEFALIILAVCFAFFALLFLTFFIVRRIRAHSTSVPLILIFLICAVISVCCGFNYYKEAKLCRKCGEKATYHTGFGKYCNDCFEDAFYRTCSQCGNEVSSYASKGGKTYCHICANKEFGYGYMYEN